MLADEVLAFPHYKFFCHQKMTEELDDHGSNEAKTWLYASLMMKCNGIISLS